MKVLLINPRFSGKTTDVPLGLAYIAAVAVESGCSVRTIDLDATRANITYDDVPSTVKEFEPNLIGISIYTDFARNAYELMKTLSPFQIPVVVGGPHPTALPEETFIYGATFVVRGEGEETFRELIEYHRGQRALNSIQGLSYLDGNKVVHNQPRVLMGDLDKIPLPAKEMFKRDVYVGRMGAEPFGGILTSRGCPSKCIYCYNQIHGRLFRFRQPLKVVAEIRLLKEKYGIKKFVFVDDSFTVRKDRSLEICQRIIDDRLDIKWTCFARPNLVDRELLSLMKQSGCTLIDYGVEHGDDASLRRLKRGMTLATIGKGLVLTRQAGISYQTNYIFGFPWDTVETVNHTLQHALKWNDRGFQSSPIVPYPGTELYEEYKGEPGLEGWWLRRDGMKWEQIKLIAKGHRLAQYSFFTLDAKTERAIEKAFRRMRKAELGWWVYWLLHLSYKISPRLEQTMQALLLKGARLVRKFWKRRS